MSLFKFNDLFLQFLNFALHIVTGVIILALFVCGWGPHKGLVALVGRSVCKWILMSMLWSLSKCYRLRGLKLDSSLLKLVEHRNICAFWILLLLIHQSKLSEHLILSGNTRCDFLLFIHYLLWIRNQFDRRLVHGLIVIIHLKHWVLLFVHDVAIWRLWWRCLRLLWLLGDWWLLTSRLSFSKLLHDWWTLNCLKFFLLICGYRLWRGRWLSEFWFSLGFVLLLLHKEIQAVWKTLINKGSLLINRLLFWRYCKNQTFFHFEFSGWNLSFWRLFLVVFRWIWIWLRNYVFLLHEFLKELAVFELCNATKTRRAAWRAFLLLKIVSRHFFTCCLYILLRVTFLKFLLQILEFIRIIFIL